MPTIYRLISRDDNRVQQFRSSYDLSIHMLGQRLSAYIVVKSDEQRGDRVVTWPDNPDIVVIEEAMRNQ
jgi:hypothetical protein